MSKVSVRIYGTDYTIAGEKSEEHIRAVAEYVDKKMREIAGVSKAPASSLAVLTAVNAADEYFSRDEAISELKKKNYQLERDTKHFSDLWEEAKASHSQYKEDMNALSEKNEELTKALAEKDKEIEDLRLMAKGLEQKLIDAGNAASAGADAKVKELETAIFDLEMENVQLKSELDRMKR